MGIINKLYNWVDGPGNKILASEVNAEFQQIVNLVNGNLDGTNITNFSIRNVLTVYRIVSKLSKSHKTCQQSLL